MFRSENHDRERFFAETANCASQVLPMHDDPLSLEAVEHYFRLYYWEQSTRWDAKNILREFHLNQDRSLPFLFGFSKVADRFKLIEHQGKPLIIPWGEKGRATLFAASQFMGVTNQPIAPAPPAIHGASTLEAMGEQRRENNRTRP